MLELLATVFCTHETPSVGTGQKSFCLQGRLLGKADGLARTVAAKSLSILGRCLVCTRHSTIRHVSASVCCASVCCASALWTCSYASPCSYAHHPPASIHNHKPFYHLGLIIIIITMAANTIQANIYFASDVKLNKQSSLCVCTCACTSTRACTGSGCITITCSIL